MVRLMTCLQAEEFARGLLGLMHIHVEEEAGIDNFELSMLYFESRIVTGLGCCAHDLPAYLSLPR
jgi:hypothetical protein